jgi:hypothetical protein
MHVAARKPAQRRRALRIIKVLPVHCSRQSFGRGR